MIIAVRLKLRYARRAARQAWAAALALTLSGTGCTVAGDDVPAATGSGDTVVARSTLLDSGTVRPTSRDTMTVSARVGATDTTLTLLDYGTVRLRPRAHS